MDKTEQEQGLIDTIALELLAHIREAALPVLPIELAERLSRVIRNPRASRYTLERLVGYWLCHHPGVWPEMEVQIAEWH